MEIIKTKYGKTIIFEQETINKEESLTFKCICKKGYKVQMHAHILQEEKIEVLEGVLAYKVSGDNRVYTLKKGEFHSFEKGEFHSFENIGENELLLKATVYPALNTKEFCIAVTKLLEKYNGKKLDIFDASYLFWKYRKYHRVEGKIKYIFFLPLFYVLGKVLGKHEKFKQYNI